MKNFRPISILILIMALVSCREGDLREIDEQAGQQVKKKYIPEWDAPQHPRGWISLPETTEEKRFQKGSVVTEEVVVEIKRDTIAGIAVRAPGSISLPDEEYHIYDRDQEQEAIYGMAYVSTNRYFSVSFDNDIFNNTDYYYTNGIRFEYVAAIFASSPLAYSMLPYNKPSINYHGITVVQNMYTPTNPDTIMTMEDDRPFAAYLNAGHFKNTLNDRKKYRQYSELQIGLIGPGSLGGQVQSQVHDIPPLGWENQIENDVVLNYTAMVEKGIYNRMPFDLNVFAEGQAGTLYTNAGGGLRVRAGRFTPYFLVPGLAMDRSAEGEHALKWQYGIFASGKMKIVAYDATLQGGVFNSTSPYTIPAEDIERFVLQASVGAYFAFRTLGITYEQFYITPEFKNALHHRWGRINVTYCF